MIAVASAACVHSHDDGRPGCLTIEEVDTRNYRNNWDPTRYFVCDDLGVTARVEKCPNSYGFQTSANKCVSFEDWVYETPCIPPSAPIAA